MSVLAPEKLVDTPTAPDYLTPESRAHRFFTGALFLRTASVIVAVALWQLLGIHYSYVVSSPSAVYHAFFKIIISQGLPAFGWTFLGMAIGFSICIVVGVPIGIVIGRSKLASLILEPYALMLFSLPFVALFPVLILVEGITMELRVSCIILAGIFPIIINTARGVRLVSADFVDVGRSLVAGRVRTIVSIVLPASTRFIFAGIRVGFARAMIGTVVFELEAANNGVGFILHRYTEQFLYGNFFAIVIVLGFIALAITNFIGWIEHWTLEPWNRRRSIERMRATAPYVATSQPTTLTRTFWAKVGLAFAGVSNLVTRVTTAFNPFVRRWWVAWTVRIVTLVAILALWNWRAENSSPAVLSTPKAVAISLWHLLVVNRQMWGPIGLSFEVLVVGFVISIVVGIPLGILMGRSRIAEKMLDPYVSFLYALPHAVFISIMVEWLGFRFNFAVAYVFVSAVFPVIVNTMSGVKGTDQNLIDTGVSFCASERKIRRSIVFPSAFPMMLTGARIAFSASWVGVIIAEILTTNTGLGGDIQYYSDEFQTPAMYGTIIVIMIIAVILLQLSVYAERRATPWLPRKALEG